MNPLFNAVQKYEVDAINLDTLVVLPGFAYIKSVDSTYLWVNYNLSQSAVGKKSVDAIKSGIDFDFFWKMYAEIMRKIDGARIIG